MWAGAARANARMRPHRSRSHTKFTEELSRRLHRPALFRVPAALLRRLGGDFANELLLGGQRVLPNRARSNGLVFLHETLRSAFEAIL